MSPNVIFDFARKEFASRYATTAFGFLWLFMTPLFYFALYSFVFNVGFRAQAPYGLDFGAWFFIGLALWLFVGEVLSQSPTYLRRFANLLKKTRVDPANFVAALLVSAGWASLPVLGVAMAAGMWLYPGTLNLAYLALAMACTFVLGAALGTLISAISLYLEDMQQLMPLISQLLFWLTPIAWPSTMLSAEHMAIMEYNPFYICVELFRHALLPTPQISVESIVYVALVASASFVAAAYLFRLLRANFVDVL